MNGFFSRARKAVVAFVVTFIAALLAAAKEGTVFGGAGGSFVDWSTVFACAGVALGAAVAVWAAPNTPSADTTRRDTGRGSGGLVP